MKLYLSLLPSSHPADGNSGNVAMSGKVAMARDGDSGPVTTAMIAARHAGAQEDCAARRCGFGCRVSRVR
jgi:hypothetical protein